MSWITDDWDALKIGLAGDANYDADNAQKVAKMQTHMGLLTSILGGINSAIGTYYAAKSQQYQQKSIALSYQFQSDMDAINARSAEQDAQWALETGKTRAMQYSLKAGQEQATVQNQTAARGIVGGVGSARDVSASEELAKQIDLLTIDSNATREAWQQRTRATAYRNRSLMAGVSAQNARLSADSISPISSGLTSLLGSASTISSQWQWFNQIKKIPGLATGGN